MNGVFYGFLGSASGSNVTAIEVSGSTNDFAYGINDSGQIVGTYSVINASPATSFVAGFLMNDNGKTFTTLEDPNGDHFTEVRGINNAGVIVGNYRDSNGSVHGFVATPGAGGTYSYTTLDDPAGHNFTSIQGINSPGQVVGSYDDSSSVAHGFVATPAGLGYSFTSLDDPGGVQGTAALDISDSGTIVGYL